MSGYFGIVPHEPANGCIDSRTDIGKHALSYT
jgi:hypothetical protein